MAERARIRDVWSALIEWVRPAPEWTFELLMKSGTRVVLDRVTKLEFRGSASGIEMLVVGQHKRAKRKLWVKALCLDQVEAIVEHR